MAKPSAPVVWATNANVASGVDAGETTRLEPSLGVKQAGIVPGTSAPGRWYNWLFGMLGDWTAYLDNLHNESAFLGANYDFTGTVKVPEVRYTTPKIYSIAVPLQYAQPGHNGSGQASWQFVNALTLTNWVSLGIDDYIDIPIKHVVHQGVEVTRVRAGIDLDAGATVVMQCYKRQIVTANGAEPTTDATGMGGNYTSTTDGVQVADITGLSFTGDDNFDFFIRIHVSGSAGSKLNWVAVDVSVGSLTAG